MKKIFNLLLVTAVITSFVACSPSLPKPTANTEPTYDFRNINWGMTRDEVESAEGRKPDQEINSSIVYSYQKAGDYTAALLYNFENNKLTDAVYFIQIQHYSYEEFVDDYSNLKNTLAEQYGQPSIHEAYKIEDENPDLADKFKDYCGGLRYEAMWHTDQTYITLTLMEKPEIMLTITYKSNDKYNQKEDSFNGL